VAGQPRRVARCASQATAATSNPSATRLPDVPVGTLTGVGVANGVIVGAGVNVFVGVSVSVDVTVGVPVGVIVGVLVGVPVGVTVGVLVGVGVAVGVGVFVGVFVGVGVGVVVGVLVGVGVCASARLAARHHARARTAGIMIFLFISNPISAHRRGREPPRRQAMKSRIATRKNQSGLRFPILTKFAGRSV
jgi:hypothetical protein